LYHSSIISSILFRQRGPLGLSGAPGGIIMQSDLIWTWNDILTRLLSYNSKAAGADLRLTASIWVNLLRIRSSDKKVLLVSLCLLIDGSELGIQIFHSDSVFRVGSKEPIHYKVQEQVNDGRAALMAMNLANAVGNILPYDSALSI
jgi:hypothetical protein